MFFVIIIYRVLYSIDSIKNIFKITQILFLFFR
nr:MAG TPA: hypothetical protein [Crassvirales sp.]